jgi:DNA-directed RNA polymerase subunit RPC12/RpoP
MRGPDKTVCPDCGADVHSWDAGSRCDDCDERIVLADRIVAAALLVSGAVKARVSHVGLANAKHGLLAALADLERFQAEGGAS